VHYLDLDPGTKATMRYVPELKLVEYNNTIHAICVIRYKINVCSRTISICKPALMVTKLLSMPT
jgi:flagellar motor switch protein FliM